MSSTTKPFPSMAGFASSLTDENEVPQWIQTQLNTFTNWCNTTIQKNPRAIRENFQPMVDLIQGLYSGVNLMYLAIQMTGRDNVNFNRKPTLRIQCIQNVQTALDMFQQDGVRFVNISANEICQGNLKLILGLIWTIIRHYEAIHLPTNKRGEGLGVPGPFSSTSQDSRMSSGDSHKEKLRNWIELMTGIRPSNFTTSFQDGDIIMKLVQRLQEDNQLSPMIDDMNDSPILRTTKAMEAAREEFRVPIIMKPSDIVYSPDELSMMTYLICMNASMKEFKERLEREKSKASFARSQQPPISASAPSMKQEDHFETKDRDYDYSEFARNRADEDDYGTYTQTSRRTSNRGYDYENEFPEDIYPSFSHEEHHFYDFDDESVDAGSPVMPPPPPPEFNRNKVTTTTTTVATRKAPPIPPKLPRRTTSTTEQRSERRRDQHDDYDQSRSDNYYPEQQQEHYGAERYGPYSAYGHPSGYHSEVQNMYYDHHYYPQQPMNPPPRRTLPPVPYGPQHAHAMYQHTHYSTNHFIAPPPPPAPVTVTQTTRTVRHEVPAPVTTSNVTTTSTNSTANSSFVIVGDRRSMKRVMKKGVFIL